MHCKTEHDTEQQSDEHRTDKDANAVFVAYRFAGNVIDGLPDKYRLTREVSPSNELADIQVIMFRFKYKSAKLVRPENTPAVMRVIEFRAMSKNVNNSMFANDNRAK